MNKQGLASNRDFNNFKILYKNLPQIEKDILHYMWKDNPDVEGEMIDDDRISLNWYHSMFEWVAENPGDYESIKSTYQHVNLMNEVKTKREVRNYQGKGGKESKPSEYDDDYESFIKRKIRREDDD